MINCTPIVVGTSLAPFHIEKQWRAVKSWIDNGFQVISCNAKEEIEIVRKNFCELPVEFVEVERTAKETVQKELPYIQDILNVVCEKTERVCGYINSDIFLSKMPDGMYEYIEKEARNSFVFIRRNEIDEYSDILNLNWTPHFDGIDTFFMDKTLVQNFYDDGFYVQSIWDLCILIKCNILGIRIKELVNPVTFHLRHPIKWNFKRSNSLAEQFINKYFICTCNTYEYAKRLWYMILYAGCEKICFCNIRNYRCLFVLDERDEDTVKSIYGQKYGNCDIVFSDKAICEANKRYDIIVHVRARLILDDIFCETVIYVMHQFGCNTLEIGRFFISERGRDQYYNELDRNMNVIKNINNTCHLYTRVTKNRSNKDNEYCKKILYLPISYEMIPLMDDGMIDRIKLAGKVYIGPAGVRAGEWFFINDKKIDIEVCGFFDNDIEKVGKKMMDKPIYSVESILKDKEASVVIASKYYSMEIEKQLASLSNTNKILNASYMLSISSDGTVYYFNFDKYKELHKK